MAAEKSQALNSAYDDLAERIKKQTLSVIVNIEIMPPQINIAVSDTCCFAITSNKILAHNSIKERNLQNPNEFELIFLSINSLSILHVGNPLFIF